MLAASVQLYAVLLIHNGALCSLFETHKISGVTAVNLPQNTLDWYLIAQIVLAKYTNATVQHFVFNWYG